MRKDNTQNYRTSNSKINHFSDFVNNKHAEKDEVDSMKRRGIDNEEHRYNLPSIKRLKYNKVTAKYDDISEPELNDKSKALEDDGPVKPDHKWKITSKSYESKFIKTFETWMTGPIDDGQIPRPNASLEVITEVPEEEISGCGCCDECTGEVDCNCCSNCTCSDTDGVEFMNTEDVKSYMFFGNLETIHREASELVEMNQEEVNSILNDGHNWAEDHISVCKELVTQVYNFLVNNEETLEHIEVSGADGESENYMFFANLEWIEKATEELMNMDRIVVDEILQNGHDWAEDHIAAAKEDMQQVYEFLKTEIK